MLDAVIVIVATATIFAIILVFALSLRLRQGEIETIFKLGCSRMTIARLIVSEILIIMLISSVVCAGLVFMVEQYYHELVRALLIR